MKYRSAWRGIVNTVMFTLTGACAVVVSAVLLGILGYLAWNGGKALSLDFFLQLPKPPGESGGGMANALAGSVWILMIAALFGIPVGFLGGVYLAEFGGGVVPFAVRYVADLLNGVPSIVIGICVYSILVVPMGGFSAFAGGVALGTILIPLVVRSTEEFLRAVPQSLREAALALGASKWQTTATVVVPASARGVLTGILLGLARVAGETAPLLFTSFNNGYWSSGFSEPAASMPVMVFTYALSPYPDWQRQAWASGLVLLAAMLLTNVCVRLLLARPPAGQR